MEMQFERDNRVQEMMVIWKDGIGGGGDLAIMPIDINPPLSHDFSGATLFSSSLSCSGQ
jgi:hypothetical protein